MILLLDFCCDILLGIEAHVLRLAEELQIIVDRLLDRRDELMRRL